MPGIDFLTPGFFPNFQVVHGDAAEAESSESDSQRILVCRADLRLSESIKMFNVQVNFSWTYRRLGSWDLMIDWPRSIGSADPLSNQFTPLQNAVRLSVDFLLRMSYELQTLKCQLPTLLPRTIEIANVSDYIYSLRKRLELPIAQ